MDPILNECQSEKENYNMIVDQTESRMVRRNNAEEEINRNRCRYKEFMAYQPQKISVKTNTSGSNGVDLRNGNEI